MDIYSLSRNFWDYAYENPEIIKPNHCALYFFAIEHCNRLGWKQKFGLPSTMAMDAIGIKSHNTYAKTLNDLVEFGLITMIQHSKNQYSANIIAISKFDKAHDKALDRALIKHGAKQRESTIQSIDSIDIPIYNTTNLQINKSTSLQYSSEFDFFWDSYNKKIDRTKCEKVWNKLTESEIGKIIESVVDYVKVNSEVQFRKNPLTYLNGKCFNDEISDYSKKESNSEPPIGKMTKGLLQQQEIYNELLEQLENGTYVNPFDISKR